MVVAGVVTNHHHRHHRRGGSRAGRGLRRGLGGPARARGTAHRHPARRPADAVRRRRRVRTLAPGGLRAHVVPHAAREMSTRSSTSAGRLPPIALSPLSDDLHPASGRRPCFSCWSGRRSSRRSWYRREEAAVEDIYVRAGRALGASDLGLFRRGSLPATEYSRMGVAVRVASGSPGRRWSRPSSSPPGAGSGGRSEVGELLPDRGGLRRDLLMGFCALLMDMGVRLVQARAVGWPERVVR